MLILRADPAAGSNTSDFFLGFYPCISCGGVAGYTVLQAVRFGFARGIFSNEAGLGSAPIAHASADSSNPAAQGMWGIFEVFADTLVVCTLTALVILTSGVADGGFTGAGMTSAAFSAVLGPWGGKMVSISLIFYAVAAIIGWSFYGEQSLSYLMPHKKKRRSGLSVSFFILLLSRCCNQAGSGVGNCRYPEWADGGPESVGITHLKRCRISYNKRLSSARTEIFL